MKYVVVFLLLVLSRYLAIALTQLHIKTGLWPFNSKKKNLNLKTSFLKKK